MGMRMLVVAAVVVLVGCSGNYTPDTTEAALDEMWSSYSPADQAGLCASMRLRGVDEVVDVFMADEPNFDRTTIRRWWLDTCSD